MMQLGTKTNFQVPTKEVIYRVVRFIYRRLEIDINNDANGYYYFLDEIIQS
jgi:hypothetical protein